MSTLRVVRGGKNAGSRERRAPTSTNVGAVILSDVVDEGDVLALEAALRNEKGADNPAPLEHGHGQRVAREYYLGVASELVQLYHRTDLRVPQEFHNLLWMLVRMGADQKLIALDQAVSQEIVSRWVSAGQTPSPNRRRGILLSALIAFMKAFEAKSLVPLQPLSGRRAHVAIAPEAPKPR